MLQFRAFPVISRYASFTFKGKQMDLREVAAQLEAAYVVAGTVRRLEDRVRITAELSDASGRQIWAQTFDADLKVSDIFAVQDEIAALIAGVTYPQLLISEIERVSDHDPSSLEAWGYALKALDAVYGLDMSRHDEAMENVEKALALDPNLAVVYWARGMLHFNSYVEDGILGDEAEARELQIIADFQKALEISPFDGASCGCLGWMYMTRGDMDSARVMFESAMEVNPNSAVLRQTYSLYLLHRNDLDAARREAQLAVRLDPISPLASYSYVGLGLVALVEGDITQAIDLTRRALQLERTEVFSQMQLAVVLYLDGQTVQAEAAFAELMRVHPNVTPRHRQLYSWLEPISGLMRLRVAEADGVAADAMTTPDLVEHVFVQLGWEPPQ